MSIHTIHVDNTIDTRYENVGYSSYGNLELRSWMYETDQNRDLSKVQLRILATTFSTGGAIYKFRRFPIDPLF